MSRLIDERGVGQVGRALDCQVERRVLPNLLPVFEQFLLAGRVQRFEHGEDLGVGAHGSVIRRASRTTGSRAMVCPSVTILLWSRGESTWSWSWAAMSSILGVDRTAPTATTFGEDQDSRQGVIIRECSGRILTSQERCRSPSCWGQLRATLRSWRRGAPS